MAGVGEEEVGLSRELSDYKPANELIVVDCSKGWKNLLCVEYPGIVENEDKAIKTLGGLEAISNACKEKGYNRLEVKVRPDSIYSKPTHAKPRRTCCLAVKLRRIKMTITAEERGGGEGETEEEAKFRYSAELVGLIDMEFNFPGMFDFQVIPPGLNNVTHKGQPVPYDPMLAMTELMDETCFSKDVPLFLPPLFFSKIDKPFNYAFKSDSSKQQTSTALQAKQRLPGQTRIKRPNLAYSIPFTQKKVPNGPHPDLPSSNHPKLLILKQLFEERPAWSRIAIQAKLKLSASSLRALIMQVAYYFTNGPWKKLWIKFGYDPRTDPTSKIYQSIDYRVPRSLEFAIITPSSTYRKLLHPLGATETDLKQQSLRLSEEDSVKRAEEKTLVEELDESAYIFYPDVYPSQRQLLYVLCDIHEESIQSMIHSNDGKEGKCYEITGWCEEGIYDKIRKKLSEIILAKAEREGHDIDIHTTSTDVPEPIEEMEP